MIKAPEELGPWKRISHNNIKTYFYVNKNGDVWNINNGRMQSSFYVNGSFRAVCFQYEGKHYQVQVHRVMAELFIPNPNEYKYVKFKDDDSDNLSVNNLYWTNTRKYNRTGFLKIK